MLSRLGEAAGPDCRAVGVVVSGDMGEYCPAKHSGDMSEYLAGEHEPPPDGFMGQWLLCYPYDALGPGKGGFAKCLKVASWARKRGWWGQDQAERMAETLLRGALAGPVQVGVLIVQAVLVVLITLFRPSWSSECQI